MAATRITLTTDNYDDEVGHSPKECRKAVAAAIRNLADRYEAEDFDYIGRFTVEDHNGNPISGDVDEL